MCAFSKPLSMPHYFSYTSACFFGNSLSHLINKELHLNFFGSSFGELFSKLRKSKGFYGLALLFVVLALFGILPQATIA